MSQYALIKPYRQFQPGFVISPGAIIGEGLVRGSVAIEVTSKEVASGAAAQVPGGLPFFADAELRKIMVARGLVPALEDRKVGKTSHLKRN